MTQRDRVLSMLGMAARAGKIESGEFSTEKAVKSGRGRLVIVAEDASGNTKKMFTNMCKYYEVPLVVFVIRYTSIFRLIFFKELIYFTETICSTP